MTEDYEDVFLLEKEQEARRTIELLGKFDASAGLFKNVPGLAAAEQRFADDLVWKARNFLQEQERVREPKRRSV